jgi:NAD-dependent epimerase/dehydratase family protein
MRLFCFGYGYSAEALGRKLSPRVTEIAGTRTNPEAPMEAGAVLAAYKGGGPSAEVRSLLAGTTHLLVSIPPDLEGDAVLRDFAADIAALPALDWVGYLSTIGVYGDAKGAWVDETSPVRPLTERSLRRAEAEQAWLDLGASTGRRVEVFRLAGIYGPGRSVIDNLRAGTARRIVKPGQVFNRIHVDDIARALAAAIDKDTGLRVFNVSDDEPAPPEDVVAHAAELLGLPVPEAVVFEAAGLSGMAASFWSECKRVSNHRIRRDLGVELLYPTYREGLRALAVR